MSNKLRPIYLDYAAATPIDQAVEACMKPYLADIFYNPSATYSASLAAKQDLETARADLAMIIGAKSSEITFTAGGTEANNLAVHGIMSRYPGSKLIVSAIEHESVLKPAEKYHSKLCPVDPGGIVDVEALKKLIDEKTVLVSIMYVNNEIGTIQPISQVAKIINDIKASRLSRGIDLPLYFHTDACQAANYLDLHVSRLGVDLMTLNAGKIYGPKQVGLLYIKAGVKINSLIDGGGQEHGLRSGTENLAGAVGMAKALDIAQKIRKTEAERLASLRTYFMSELRSLRPDIKFNGSEEHKVANNIHFTIPGVDNEWLLIKLDQANILVASGSACSAANQEPSHVLSAIGLDTESARSSIRLSLGRSTSQTQINRTLKVLGELI